MATTFIRTKIIVNVQSSRFIIFFLLFKFVCFVDVVWSAGVAPNVLALGAVADFGAFHCQPSTNVDRSTALDLTTSTPIAANGC
jgi:hypothetical protein